jgi:hypothetical protein
LWAVFALWLLISPATLLGVLGAETSAVTALVARIFGSELAGLALVSWFTRGAEEVAMQRRLAFSYVVSNTLGFGVSLQGTLAGTFNGLGWVLVVLYLVYAVGFAAFLVSHRG